MFARDRKAASAAADALMKKGIPAWLVMEAAVTWCQIAKDIDADESLAPADKFAQSEAAVKKAVACLERIRAVGDFDNPERVRWFNPNPQFDPVRGKFDPQKK